jgi:tetratricopeptide (TPR) repeat protein
LQEAVKLAQTQLTGKQDDQSKLTDREVYFTIADMDVRDKRWKEAAQQLDKAEPLSSTPEEKAFLYYYRGHVADEQKLYDQAEEEFRKGLELDPKNAPIENDYGYMLAERGQRLDDALAMLKKAVIFDPQNGAYLDSLAWAYYKLGQYAVAEDYARKAVARMSTDPTVLDHLGEIYAKNGKLQQAVVEWQKSLAEYATSLPPEADPTDVAKVQHKLEGARVKLAHVGK